MTGMIKQFFGVGKFWQVFFWVTFKTNVSILNVLMLSGNFYGWEIQNGILGGLKFGPGIFWGFV